MQKEDQPKFRNLRPAKLEDPLLIGPHLRQEDKDEIYATSGSSEPVTSLCQGVLLSKYCYTAVTDEGTPVGMLGIVPQTKGKGKVWALFTDEITEYPLLFTKVSKAFFDYFNENGFEELGNVVDEANVVHVKWLKALGCDFTGEIPSPFVSDRNLLKFTRRITNV